MSEVDDMRHVSRDVDGAECATSNAALPDEVIGTAQEPEASPEGPTAVIDDDSGESSQEEEARAEEERLAALVEEERQRREEAADAAVETLSSGAGFVGRYGVYYDAAQRPKETAARPAGEDEGEEADSYADDDELAERVARLTATVARQPLHREIYYKVLAYCDEARALQDIEEFVAALPAFAHAANNPYHFICSLEQAGGLARFELDEQGEVVTPERKEGLTEDEVDDLVASYSFMTTPAGMAVVEQHTPRARIIELLGLVPERRDAYIELLEFLEHDSHTYAEVNQLFHGRDCLVRMVDGEPQVMQPSVFLDKLEAAAAIEWRDGWTLTGEGRAYLDELRQQA